METWGISLGRKVKGKKKALDLEYSQDPPYKYTMAHLHLNHKKKIYKLFFFDKKSSDSRQVLERERNRSMEMKELRNSAMAYYESLPAEQKNLAYDFFRALDADGDGSVSLSEFLEFLHEADIYDGHPSDTFTMFDRDGNGRLDFNEVIVLFYYVTIGPGASSRQQRSSRRRKRGLRGGRRGDRQVLNMLLCGLCFTYVFYLKMSTRKTPG